VASESAETTEPPTPRRLGVPVVVVVLTAVFVSALLTSSHG